MALRGFTMKARLILVLLIGLQFSIEAADVDIDASVSAISQNGIHVVVFTTSTTGYWFYIDADTSFDYRKTTDTGATWGSPIVVEAATVGQIAFDVWFDKWTPGDTGTVIHTWYFDTTNDKVFYRALDTNGDSLGTQQTAFTGVSAVLTNISFVSGTKSRSGYLYAAFDLDAGAERGLVRSTDNGATWSANLSTTFVEAVTDTCILFPATGTGDDNDIWAIYQDFSANELTMKMWDSSAAAQVESSSMQTMTASLTEVPGSLGYAGAVRLSDGHLFVVSFSERDTATEDFQAWEVSAVNAGSLTGITALTNITTNIDDMYWPKVYIDAIGTIYVAYVGKRDGSESLGTTTKSYYTKSTDGGTTWSAGDTAYMESAATDIRAIWAPLSGPLFGLGWKIGAASLRFNVVNSVVSPLGASGFLRLIGH
jgi:hypothetical protein